MEHLFRDVVVWVKKHEGNCKDVFYCANFHSLLEAESDTISREVSKSDSTNGYTSNFVVYTGKSDDGHTTTNLGQKAVIEVCRDTLGKG